MENDGFSSLRNGWTDGGPDGAANTTRRIPGFPAPPPPPDEHVAPGDESSPLTGDPAVTPRDESWPQLAPLTLPPLEPPAQPAMPSAPPGGSSFAAPAEFAASGHGGNGRTVVLAAIAVIVAAGMFALGGVVFHSSSSTSSPDVSPVAAAAAQVWLQAAAYHGPAVPGLPVRLSRQGAIPGSLEPVASWHDAVSTGELYIVSAPGRQPFGLAVTLFANKLSLPPTVTGLPFTSGAVPPSAGAPTGLPAKPPAALQTWLAGNFGTASAPGSLTTELGLGATGPQTMLSAWAPKAGGTVYRTQVNLASDAPGTLTAHANANTRALAGARLAEQRALASFQTARSADALAKKKLAGDQTTATPPPTTAPPTTPTTVPVVAAVTATPATTVAPPATTIPPARAAAMKALGPDRAGVTRANAALSSALNAYRQAQKAVQMAISVQRSGPQATPMVTAVGTYDVWIAASGRLLGWGPASYTQS
jgi:hypothetical protein